MDTPPTPEAGDRASRTKERVYAAARESILHRGITRTSMVEISRRSGVGRTTLYRHWSDVSTLLAELLTTEALSVFQAIDLEAKDAAGLADVITDIATALRDNDVLAALRKHEPELMSRYVFTRLGTSQRYIIDVLRDVIARAAPHDPTLADRDPEITATTVFVCVQGAVFSAPIVEPPLTRDLWRTELHRVVSGYLGA